MAASDYGQTGSTAFSSAITYAGFSITGYNDFVLNASGIAAINKTGITRLSLRNANYDVSGASPSAWVSDAYSYLNYNSADAAGTSTDPKLTITYVGVPKTIDNVPYSGALPWPMQSGLWFNGRYWSAFFMDGNGTTGTTPKIAYADISDSSFGTTHAIPYMPSTVTRGYEMPVWYGWVGTYFSYAPFVRGTTDSMFQIDGSIDASASWEYGTGAPFPDYNTTGNVATDYIGYSWYIAKTFTSPTYYVQVRRSGTAYTTNAFDAAVTLRTLSSSDSAQQIVTYRNGDVEACYSDSTTLYCKHFTAATTSWGTEETVATGMSSFMAWRVIVLQNQKTFVTYRDGAAGYYLKIKTKPFGGSWSAASDAATDISTGDTTAYFTSTANSGKAEQAYIFYYDGTNIVYKTYTDGSLSAKTTLVSSPSLMSALFTAPYHESEKMGMLYHVTGNQLKLEYISITPDDFSTGGDDGDLVSKNGSPLQATFFVERQMQTFGDYTFFSWTGRDNQGWVNVYNNATGQWMFASAAVTGRYWDAHNTITSAMDSNGYVYFSYAGREAMNSSHDIVVKKYSYPLGHASWTPTGFTDISPLNQGRRGYKYLAIDSSDVVYLLTGDTNGLAWYLTERRGGVWSANTTVINVNSGDPSDYSYIDDMVLGKEFSGQKSLRVFWSWKDASVQGVTSWSNQVQAELAHIKIVPQGNGTFLAYKADGTSLTLPCAYNNRDLIYSGLTGTYWVRTWGGVDLYDANTPVAMHPLSSKTDGSVANVTYWKWNGSSWGSVEVENSGLSSVFGRYYPKVFVENSIVYSNIIKPVSGTNQLFEYKSIDAGTSWLNAQRTTLPYEMVNALIERYSMFSMPVYFNYSEVRFTGRLAPLPVTNLTAARSGATQINVTWTDNATDEISYYIDRKVDGGAYATLDHTLAAGTQSYTDTTVTTAHSYQYRVSPNNGAFIWVESNIVSAAGGFSMLDAIRTPLLKGVLVR